MSRSNPTESISSPSNRWFFWHGEQGQVRYFDKAAKENVIIKEPFTFILLDELSTIRGWHDASESGIYSNEVRDTREQTFLVKAFKGGVLVEGLYTAIKDRVGAVGGYFVSSNYIAYRDGAEMKIGVIQFHGAALRAWMEFRKESKGDLYKQAVRIKGFTEGKKGKIVFRVPNFSLLPASQETNDEAIELDKVVQEYLTKYFARRVGERPAATAQEAGPEPEEAPVESEPEVPPGAVEPDDKPIADTDDNCPF